MEAVFVEKKRTKLFALPICFVTYYIMQEKITIRSGFLTTVEDDAFMYKIQDVRLTRTMLERFFGLGTITCFTGDTTHPELKLLHIKHSRTVKEFLMTASEEARRKRRTMHTLDIDAPSEDSEMSEGEDA